MKRRDTSVSYLLRMAQEDKPFWNQKKLRLRHKPKLRRL